MNIQSNTLGKLQKIRNGNVFESSLIFIRELLQNSQRSKASNVHMFVDEGTFICKDDGCGCKNPENVFTLDLSSWESTNEGYGIGFWAVLGIPEISSITVRSYDWECFVDVEHLFSTGDLSVTKKTIQKMNGFEVCLKSSYFDSNFDAIEKYVFDVAKLLPMKTFINECQVFHQEVLDLFRPKEYAKIYDNRFFKAKLSISNDSYPNIPLYYDKRLVCDFTACSYVSGIIEIKAEKITLREPDRTYYKRDDKYYMLTEKFEECCKDLYRSYVKDCGVDDDDFFSAISYWLDVKDFEKYLVFDDVMVQEGLKFKKSEKPEKEIAVVFEPSESINKEMYERENSVVKQGFVCNSNSVAAMPSRETDMLKNNVVEQNTTYRTTSLNSELFRDKVKKMKKAVWCRRNEYSVYEKEIQKARYKGIKIIIAKNVLYENALRAYGILHIADLQNAFSEVFVKENICLKTEKEEAFISLLKPICKRFNLPENVFLMANISIVSHFCVGDKIISKETISNKKDDIKVCGVCDGCNIYLDRTAMSLNRFNIKKGTLGKSELKAIMYNVNTIAHELAHLLFKTTDNTPEHYNKEINIQQEIIKLYM